MFLLGTVQFLAPNVVFPGAEFYGTVVGGALGDAVGIVSVLIVQGGAYVLAGLLVLVLLAGDTIAEKSSVE